MKSHVSALVVGAEVVTPEPVNAEYLDIAANANRLDDENFGAGTLTAAKLVTGAMHRLEYQAIEASVDVDINQGDTTAIGAVPDADGDPWVVEVDTQGGVLQMTLRCQVSTSYVYTAGSYFFCAGALWVGLRVNGEIVARSQDQGPLASTDTLVCHTVLPVGPGTHVVEVVFGLDNPVSTPIAILAPDRVTFDDRALSVVEALQ